MSNPVYKFSEARQKEIAALLLFDIKEFVQNLEFIKPEFFDNPILADVTKLVVKFYKAYSRVPTEDEFIEEVTARLDKDTRLSQDEYLKVVEHILRLCRNKKDLNPAKDSAIAFARYQAARLAIRESATLVEKEDYPAILKKVRDALAIGEVRDLGTFYGDTLEQRLTDRREGKTTRSDLAVPTGLQALDDVLGGGLCPGELGIIMGPMKRGKTVAAHQFAWGALDSNRNVIYYGLEGTSIRTQTRIDSMISGIPKEELKDREDEVREQVKKFLDADHKGSLVIKHFPANAGTVWAFEAHLKRLQAMTGFEPDVIFADYLGLMRPSDKMIRYDGSSGGRYLLLGDITKELLALAQKNNYAIWLLHQATKTSLKKITVGMGDSADSAEPMRHADIIITLSQDDQERDLKPPQIRLYVAGGKDVPDDVAIPYEFHGAIGQLRPVGSEV